jgi:glycerophosphoryl diester phosphodiesterase
MRIARGAERLRSRRRTAAWVAAGFVLTGATACGADPSADRGPDSPSPHRMADSFDLQAHRGGAGLVTENTIPAYENALSLGVSTLELDAEVTKDRVVVISHDTRINEDKCRDTAPATPSDPAYPYVGKLIKDLTLAQVRTLDCGFK